MNLIEWIILTTCMNGTETISTLHSSTAYPHFPNQPEFVGLNIRNPREVVLRQGDHFARILHMHETPVLAEPIKVVHEDEELVVVNKPASYNVGPMWNTRLNCVRFSLMKEFGYGDIRNIHRIDRLTSGVLIFAKVRMSVLNDV